MSVIGFIKVPIIRAFISSTRELYVNKFSNYSQRKQRDLWRWQENKRVLLFDVMFLRNNTNAFPMINRLTVLINSRSKHRP